MGILYEGTDGPRGHKRRKPKEEGQWPNPHIILGIEFDSDSLCVRLPDAKVDGVRFLFGQILEEKGSR